MLDLKTFNNGCHGNMCTIAGESSAGVKRTADATYSDPLGQLPERPKTSAQTRPLGEDEFDDADLTDELLPE